MSSQFTDSSEPLVNDILSSVYGTKSRIHLKVEVFQKILFKKLQLYFIKDNTFFCGLQPFFFKWSRVEKSKLEILQHQLDPTGNFLSYRATLKAAIWRAKGAKNASERLIIPFFGLQLKDLYELCEYQ